MHFSSDKNLNRDYTNAADLLGTRPSAPALAAYARMTTLGLKSPENDTQLHKNIRSLLSNELISAEQAVDWLCLATRIRVEAGLVDHTAMGTTIGQLEYVLKNERTNAEWNRLQQRVEDLLSSASSQKEAA